MNHRYIESISKLKVLFILAFCLANSFSINGQQSEFLERKTVEFSEAEKEKNLYLDMDHGSVNISGSENQNAEIIIYSSQKLDIYERMIPESEGIAKDHSKSVEINIIEKSNKVYIQSHSHFVDSIEIKIPKRTNIFAHIYVGKDALQVKNINGDIDIGVEHGPIIIDNVKGSVQATVFSFYGEGIFAEYSSFLESSIHYFSTHSGPINLTIPDDSSISITSYNKKEGKFKSDFSFEKDNSSQKSKSKDESKLNNVIKHSISLNEGKKSEMSIFSINGEVTIKRSTN